MTTDVLGIIEAVYAETPDTQAWLANITAAAAPVLDLGFGLLTRQFVIDPQRGPVYVNGAASGRYGAALMDSGENMLAEVRERALPAFVAQVSLLSQLARPTLGDTDFIQRHLDRVGGAGGAKDVLGIVGADASGRGLLLSAFVPEGWRLTPAIVRRFSYLTSHLATGSRLRDAPEASPDEAVLDAGGKLYHAVDGATSRGAQAALRRAARAIDRARLQRSRAPDAALEGWRALVEARWSLVDRFDSDGRTFLIAKANPPKPPPLRSLTARERAVVALAALGRSNKLIAYELGLATGTVGSYLVRAQRKLGARSRAELIRLFHSTLLPEALRSL